MMDGLEDHDKKIVKERLNRSRFLDWMDRRQIEWRIEPLYFGFVVVHVFFPDGSKIGVSNFYADEWKVDDREYISYMNMFELVDRILDGLKSEEKEDKDD